MEVVSRSEFDFLIASVYIHVQLVLIEEQFNFFTLCISFHFQSDTNATTQCDGYKDMFPEN